MHIKCHKPNSGVRQQGVVTMTPSWDLQDFGILQNVWVIVDIFWTFCRI